jgi:hypothetical protein
MRATGIPEKLFEPALLFRGQLRTDFLVDKVEFLAKFGGDLLPKLPAPLLALVDDFVDPITLLGGECQLLASAE